MIVACAALLAGCADKTTSPTPVLAKLTAPVADAPSDNFQLDSLRPTLTVKNGTSSQPTGARTYEFQISDSSTFPATTSLKKRTISGFSLVTTQSGVMEDASGRTSFAVTEDLQPTTRYYWRARLVQGTAQSEFSAPASFKTKLVGYNRVDELYDPLIHGETVGDRIGTTTFIPGRGIRLESNQSYVRYLLPHTVSNGEFSMEVEGLAANAGGDKSKVFGMQEGQDDFITNHYRVDVQYRGIHGAPPNAITFRALYGSSDDLDVRYEPATAVRFASVFLLNPTTPYFWKATWGSEFRVTVVEGGMDGTNVLYNIGVASPNGRYAPNPHYAYLGAPTGRSGAEAATIPGTIYRNVWLSNHARPQSLGSAISRY
jgi:hypothetical protein